MQQTVLTKTQKARVKAFSVPPAHISDMVLIERIKSGDVDAYASLMRRYNQRMYRIARSIVIDDAASMDIVQEAHIKAFTQLDNFRGPTGLASWLATITRNEALMYLRRYKKELSQFDDELHVTSQIDDQIESTRHNSLPDAVLENEELKKLIDKNIDKLPAPFRTVFILRAVEQFSVKETAQILDIKEVTVKTRFFRAKRNLRALILSGLDEMGMKVYEFGGDHCDTLVHNVMQTIRDRQ